MKTLTIVLAVAGIAAGLPAVAEEGAVAKSVAIGERVNCLDLARIRNTRVIDDRAILFYMHGNEVYRNTLPHQCPQLGFEKTFTYSTSLPHLCSTDIITVLFASQLQQGASCGLGMFEKIDPASIATAPEEQGQ